MLACPRDTLLDDTAFINTEGERVGDWPAGSIGDPMEVCYRGVLYRMMMLYRVTHHQQSDLKPQNPLGASARLAAWCRVGAKRARATSKMLLTVVVTIFASGMVGMLPSPLNIAEARRFFFKCLISVK